MGPRSTPKPTPQPGTPNPRKYTRTLAPTPHFLCGAMAGWPAHTATDLPQDPQQALGHPDPRGLNFPDSSTNNKSWGPFPLKMLTHKIRCTVAKHPETYLMGPPTDHRLKARESRTLSQDKRPARVHPISPQV